MHQLIAGLCAEEASHDSRAEVITQITLTLLPKILGANHF